MRSFCSSDAALTRTHVVELIGGEPKRSRKTILASYLHAN